MYQINIPEKEESNGVVKIMKFHISFFHSDVSVISQRLFRTEGERGLKILI